MISVVILYVISLLFANISYLFYINKELNIRPFSFEGRDGKKALDVRGRIRR